ncbi:MAG: GntR family transcriptional regulator [Acidimicrobiaceae bacterium]|nr:GntR family transcriptional regulator [Acidimicrobiaceae bacterium]
MQSSRDGATLTEQVVATIREAILNGKLEPGTLYSVYRMADEIGISRTPVREALLRLADAGMVRFERNRGFRVLRTSVRELQEVFQLRLLLEVPAAYRAAHLSDEALRVKMREELAEMRSAAIGHDENLFMAHDRALHELVLAASQNNKLVSSVRDLRFITMTLGASTVDRSRTLSNIADEHQPLVDAIENGDSTAAAAAMHHHIVHTGQLLLEQLIKDGRDSSGLDPQWASSFTADVQFRGSYQIPQSPAK